MFSKMTTRTFQNRRGTGKGTPLTERIYTNNYQSKQLEANANSFKQTCIDIEYLEEHKDYIPLCVEQESRTVTDMNKSQRSHL